MWQQVYDPFNHSVLSTLIWNSDPIADITVLQRPSEISTIIKDGRVVDRGAVGFRQLPDEPPRARASISA